MDKHTNFSIVGSANSAPVLPTQKIPTFDFSQPEPVVITISGTTQKGPIQIGPPKKEVGVDKEWVKRLLDEFHIWIEKNEMIFPYAYFSQQKIEEFLDESEVWNAKNS